MKLRKLCLGLAVIMGVVCSVNTAFAASSNSINKTSVVKDGEALSGVYLKIIPKDEIATGDSIIITFENAEVFSQAVIDGTESDKNADGYKSGGYQYGWNGDDFSEFLSYGTLQLPFEIERLSKTQIEVRLINVPQKYCDTDMYQYIGLSGKLYYYIPMVVSADGEGDIDISIDSNDSAISGSSYTGGSSVSSGTTASTTTTTTTVTEVEEDETETTTAAEVSKTVRVQINSSEIVVDGESYTVDAAAYIQTSTQSTMVPLRAVAISFADDLTAADDSQSVEWIADTKTAVIYYNDNVIEFTANSETYVLNGETLAMPNGIRAEITDGRMYVPFRLLGETMGLEVSWEADSKTAVYTMK